jgi:transcription antitermination factor NusG
MQCWYALKTKPQRELVVRDQLRTRGIETYLPLWHPTPMHSAKNKLAPFFPTYLFANVDFEETSLSSLAYMPGMHRIVMCDGQPVRVAQTVIAAIDAQIRSLEASIRDTVGNCLVHGDKVKITGGPFEGYDAIFDRYVSAGDRVRLLIDFLQKQSPLTIERTLVQKRLFENSPMRPRMS